MSPQKLSRLLSIEELREMVRLPEGTMLEHWLASHCQDFYNMTKLLYGTVTEFCTEESCPAMSCGRRYEYVWKDKTDARYKKGWRCSASTYVELLMDWAEQQLTDDAIFPTSESCNAAASPPYPSDFHKIVSNIAKRLFRVYAHVYHTHYFSVQNLDLEAHLNTTFQHFVLFSLEFGLLEKAEMSPLSDLIEDLLGKDIYTAPPVAPPTAVATAVAEPTLAAAAAAHTDPGEAGNLHPLTGRPQT
eukprot:Rhum_TRINITY_DN19526_c0_g1::Rhum_TRINITY_DN19526_c0_g1_i1::g.170205::m.170205/K06685/MOB1, Mats; MOB kinase activator 1